ncbi:scabin-related ADP-ribosyltransferase [Streptomyces sp. HUAS TT7]|uniref:scabin-related ADP-ribosyltransferase n=1 Tax=Streptomyces sp. HUAS TT7 TaxID=3447507 RepID=UPI003F65BB8B
MPPGPGRPRARPDGIDVNASHPKNFRTAEQEVTFPGGLRAENIKGVWERTPDGQWGKFTLNLNYQPPVASAPPPVPGPDLPPGWTL